MGSAAAGWAAAGCAAAARVVTPRAMEARAEATAAGTAAAARAEEEELHTSESSCALAAVFSSLPFSAVRSWLSSFAFFSRFFSFSYVFSTTSCSLAYLLRYSCACGCVSLPAATSSSRL